MDILGSILKDHLIPKDYYKPKIEIRNYYLKWNDESYGISQKEIPKLNRIVTNAPDEVARVILEAIKSDGYDLRYVVGDNAVRLLESKKSMPEGEFKGFMMKNFFGISGVPKRKVE